MEEPEPMKITINETFVLETEVEVSEEEVQILRGESLEIRHKTIDAVLMRLSKVRKVFEIGHGWARTEALDSDGEELFDVS